MEPRGTTSVCTKTGVDVFSCNYYHASCRRLEDLYRSKYSVEECHDFTR
jgi:hypothetical protein